MNHLGGIPTSQINLYMRAFDAVKKKKGVDGDFFKGGSIPMRASDGVYDVPVVVEFTRSGRVVCHARVKVDLEANDASVYSWSCESNGRPVSL
jgi:hypothetical protein